MRNFVVAVLALALFAPAAAAEEKFSAEEKAEIIAATAGLEKDPNNKDLIAKRDKYLKLVFERDLPPILCMTPVLEIAEKLEDERYMELLMGQSSLAVLAHYLEHPEQREDRTAMNVFAADSALRGYQAARDQEPKLKNEALEELLARKDLKEHLAENVVCD